MKYLNENGEMNKFQNMMGALMGVMGEMQNTYDSNKLKGFIIYMNTDKKTT